MKELKNPELKHKFNVGDQVKQLAKIEEVGEMDVVNRGHRQRRFSVKARCGFGSVSIFEEWQLERIHPSTPDQLTPARTRSTPWLA